MFASGVVFSMKAWILSAHEVYLGLRFSHGRSHAERRRAGSILLRVAVRRFKNVGTRPLADEEAVCIFFFCSNASMASARSK